MKHTLELLREYFTLAGKPIHSMTNRELRIIKTETPSFDELDQVEQELKQRRLLKQTSIESIVTMTGSKIIIEP